MQTTIDATGSASATLAWERYMNPDRWPEWAPQIMGVDYEHDRLTADTTGRVHGPLCVRIDFEILDVDETEWTWTWRAWWQQRALGLTLTHAVTARPGGSRTWLTAEGSPLLVLPYAPVAKIALMQLVKA
ncbi:MarR family transcriptional regulator [Rhodococcus sp. BGS-1C]|uniref:MarR family transcriptional regulator n=1 Tax=unclassified Rhodococcus (in: high G+C Gram-positive bacteria) TaxID=192944 RepID=UPI0019D08567|nr:MarR family transcriptional regulator [Rhodococcus sp. KRD197]